MPVYAFSCATCGPFELRRPADQSGVPLACPECSAPAKRVYTVPGIPSRAGALGTATERERATMRRAATGEPSRTGRPPGLPVPRSPHRH